MSKMTTLLKGALAAALLLGVSSSAGAVSFVKDQEYFFSSNYTLEDPAFEGYFLGGSFTFKCTTANPYQTRLTNFVVSTTLLEEKTGDNYLSLDNNGDGTYNLPQRLIMSDRLAFSNADGDYPFSYNYEVSDGEYAATQDIYVTITPEEDGSLTVPDFTVVKYDDDTHTATIVAKFSNGGVSDSALPEIEQLAGNYTFSATLSDVDPDFNDYFKGQFDFTAEYIDASSNLRLFGFINEEYQNFIKSYDNETGVITLYQQIKEDYDTFQTLMFANAAGENPEGYPGSDGEWVDEYYLHLTIDAKGTVSIPDFTVVGVEMWAFGDPEIKILAKFTNVKCTKTDGFAQVEKVDFPGVYTVTGTRVDYTGSQPVSKQSAFYLGINDDLMATQIAGYDGVEIYGYDEGSSWIIPVYNAVLDVENGANIVLGNQSTESYQDSGQITLAYNDGEWNFTDFTVWSQTTATSADKVETVSKLLYEWKNLQIVKGQQELPVEPHDFSGTHNFVWYRTDYSNPETPITTQQDMNISINSTNQLTAIANYSVNSEFIGWGYNTGIVSGDKWTLPTRVPYNVIDMTNMSTGEGLFLGGPSITISNENQIKEEEIVLTYNESDDTYSLSDFTIWQKAQIVESGDTDEDGNTSGETKTEWKLLYKWSSTGTVTPDVGTSVEIIGADDNAPVEYYNLQGVRVVNPERGIFIMRQGKTAKKVIINK